MDNTKEIRKRVKQYIDKTDDTTVKMIYAMLEAKEEKDWWDELPAEIQNEIDAALKDLDKGKGIPHEVVLKKYSKWFTK